MARKIMLVNPWPNRIPGAASNKATPLFKEIKMAKPKHKKPSARKAAPAKAVATKAARKAPRKVAASVGKKVRPVGYYAAKSKTLTLAPYGHTYSHKAGVTVKNPTKKHKRRKTHRNPSVAKAVTNKNTLISVGSLVVGWGVGNFASNKLAGVAFISSRPWALKFKGLLTIAVSAFLVSRTKKDSAAQFGALGLGASGLADVLYQNINQSRQFILPSMAVPAVATAGAGFSSATPHRAFMGTPISRKLMGAGDDSMRGGGDV